MQAGKKREAGKKERAKTDIQGSKCRQRKGCEDKRKKQA
jgi:hypothetical protein